MRLWTLTGAVVLTLALAAPASAAQVLPPADLAASPGRFSDRTTMWSSHSIWSP